MWGYTCPSTHHRRFGFKLNVIPSEVITSRFRWLPQDTQALLSHLSHVRSSFSSEPKIAMSSSPLTFRAGFAACLWLKGATSSPLHVSRQPSTDGRQALVFTVSCVDL